MDKEKVQQFLQLLDGVTQREWEILKHQIDLLCRVESGDWKLKVGPKAVEFFGDRTYELITLARPDEDSAKDLLD
ncbi:MAG: hypothetical protein HUJ63_05205 [Enterococcus sp.]|nr:hypothetical protein [Enterococcus sp.]